MDAVARLLAQNRPKVANAIQSAQAHERSSEQRHASQHRTNTKMLKLISRTLQVEGHRRRWLGAASPAISKTYTGTAKVPGIANDPKR